MGRDHVDDPIGDLDLEPVKRLAKEPSAVSALTAFIDAPQRELTGQQVAKEAGFSIDVWYSRARDALLEMGLITEAGTVDRAAVYELRDTEALRGFKHLRAGLNGLDGKE